MFKITTSEEVRQIGDTFEGDFGTVTYCSVLGELMYRVDYLDGTWQHFDRQEDAVDMVTDYSGAHRDN